MIAKRTFTMTDQEAFARWSGDRNPIHMDPVVARRSLAGAPVVHGMHLLLWALNEALDDPAFQFPTRVRAEFRKFVLVGQPVSLNRLEGRAGQVIWKLFSGDGAVATIRFGAPENDRDDWTAASLPEVGEELQEPTLDQMRQLSGLLQLRAREIASSFPRVASRLSEQTLSALARLSGLVGMACPGLHSILAGVDVDLWPEAVDQRALGFRSTKVDERYRLVRMQVRGPGLQGCVEAFVRPEPIEALNISKAAELVSCDHFADRRALVIGGSRGIGAVTAKLLVAGGADVTVTYASGSADAASICKEVAAHGQGTCRAITLDVCQDVATPLAALDAQPTHIYYFATPRIFLQKRPEFDRKVFDRFVDFYVAGFDAICRYFSAAAEPLHIFYPSSVAVTDRPAGLTEYAMAKAAGELLCADLMRLHPNLHIVAERLPRILTDQTATVQQVPGERPESVMLPLLTRSDSPI